MNDEPDQPSSVSWTITDEVKKDQREMSIARTKIGLFTEREQRSEFSPRKDEDWTFCRERTKIGLHAGQGTTHTQSAVVEGHSNDVEYELDGTRTGLLSS